ncbi:MAG TPA: hypothetical protein PK971_00880, partial [Saprospiraceae bacterium]|nr:hypothetical protein [Saprospiraceae bacterium]
MKSILPLCLFLYLFATVESQAQREFSTWVFGRGSGLQFMPDNTIVQFSSSVFSREGVAAISDAQTGDLLFYTDGTRIWDRTHDVMMNGSGLSGDYSSAQSAVVVPKPGDPARYYVFAADYLGGAKGYTYSVVNMAANIGLGAVEAGSKNTLLLQNNTEKITVARHCNKRDFWLILRESGGNRFWVYLIDSNGLNAPKSYDIGAVIDQDTWNEVGYLEMSGDQRMLAHAIGPSYVFGPSMVEVFRFDNANGSLTGPFATIPDMDFAYGVEFSADSKLLYISNNHIPGTARVLQYDLSLGSSQAIVNSGTLLVASATYDYGAIQIAPDGKIYVSKENGYDIGSQYLDVIHFPSVAGTGCTYQENALQLLVGQSLIGLPNFPNYLFASPPTISAKKNCSTGAFDFSVNYAEASSSAKWNFGDPASGSSNTSQLLEPSHTFSDTGMFEIRAIFASACGADTVRLKVKVTEYPPIPDTTICQGREVVLHGPVPATTWNGVTTSSTYTVAESGSVQYQFKDDYGCLVTDFVEITVLAPSTTI